MQQQQQQRAERVTKINCVSGFLHREHQIPCTPPGSSTNSRSISTQKVAAKRRQVSAKQFLCQYCSSKLLYNALSSAR